MPQESWPYQSIFFWASCSWWSEGLFGQSLSIALPIQSLRGLPCLGSLFVVPCLRHIEGQPHPPLLGSYSVDLHVRHLNGHPGWGPSLLFSESGIWWASLSIAQLQMLVCGEREAMVIAPPPTHDSAISPCFHGSPAFLHRPFPPQSPSHPLDPSLHSQQQPSPWDCSTIPKLQLPAATPSRGPASLSRVCMFMVTIVCFLFHLGCHRSSVSLSALNVSSLTQTIALMWG